MVTTKTGIIPRNLKKTEGELCLLRRFASVGEVLADSEFCNHKACDTLRDRIGLWQTYYFITLVKDSDSGRVLFRQRGLGLTDKIVVGISQKECSPGTQTGIIIQMTFDAEGNPVFATGKAVDLNEFIFVRTSVGILSAYYSDLFLGTHSIHEKVYRKNLVSFFKELKGFKKAIKD